MPVIVTGALNPAATDSKKADRVMHFARVMGRWIAGIFLIMDVTTCPMSKSVGILAD